MTDAANGITPLVLEMSELRLAGLLLIPPAHCSRQL